MHSDDTYLRTFALKTALETTDSALRSAALHEALRSSSLTVKIVGHVPGYDVFQPTLGDTIRIDLQDSGSSSGRFHVSSSISKTEGALWLSGEAMSFSVPADKVFELNVVCNGDEKLQRQSVQLRGTMRCWWYDVIGGPYTSDYSITTSALP